MRPQTLRKPDPPGSPRSPRSPLACQGGQKGRRQQGPRPEPQVPRLRASSELAKPGFPGDPARGWCAAWGVGHGGVGNWEGFWGGGQVSACAEPSGVLCFEYVCNLIARFNSTGCGVYFSGL